LAKKKADQKVVEEQKQHGENQDSGIPKIKWSGTVTELATMFYNLHNRRLIDSTKTGLQHWIVANFTDIHGEPIKLSSLQTYFNESKPEKRANVGANFEPDSLFSIESE
jgi:hypothetical protein